MNMFKRFLPIFIGVLVILGGGVYFAGAAGCAPFKVASGGTGECAFTSNTVLIGNGTGKIATTTAGTNGFVLALVGGVPTWVATSSINNGVNSITVPQGTFLGALTFATTSNTTNGITSSLTITGSGSTLTFGSNQSGTLTVAGGGTGAATLTGCLTGNGTGAITGSGTCNTSNATVSSIATNNGITGGTITTTGTIGLAALGSAGVLGAVTATVPTVQATSTLYGVAPYGSLLSSTGSVIAWLATSSLMTGTTGQVPYFTGTNTLFGTSSLFINTLGSVGIGSTTPWATLSVGSGTASSSIVVAEYKYSAGSNLATSTTQTLDARTAPQIHWRLGSAATTLTLCNFEPGQKFIVVIENPSGGTAGALTWAACAGSILLWTGGSAPSQTTTANKQDVWSFLATQGSSTMAILGASTPNF